MQGQIADKSTRKPSKLAGNLVLFCKTPRTVPCRYPVFILIYLCYTSFLKKFVGKYHGNHQKSAKCSFAFPLSFPVVRATLSSFFVIASDFIGGRYKCKSVNVYISTFTVKHARKMFMLHHLENLS